MNAPARDPLITVGPLKALAAGLPEGRSLATQSELSAGSYSLTIERSDACVGCKLVRDSKAQTMNTVANEADLTIELAGEVEAATVASLVIALTSEICDRTDTEPFPIDLPGTTTLCRRLLEMGHYMVLLGASER